MWMDKETDYSVTAGDRDLQAAPATALPFAALPAAIGTECDFCFSFSTKKVDLQGSVRMKWKQRCSH